MCDLCFCLHNSAIVFPGAQECGNVIMNPLFFDTIKLIPSMDIAEIQHRARQKEINLRIYPDDMVRFIVLYYFA